MHGTFLVDCLYLKRPLNASLTEPISILSVFRLLKFLLEFLVR